MIRSFGSSDTAAVWSLQFTKRISPELAKRAREKMHYIHSAGSINDLRVPPSNHLGQLKGDRKGQHSIRINQQWRICFVWSDGGADDVEITDYH